MDLLICLLNGRVRTLLRYYDKGEQMETHTNLRAISMQCHRQQNEKAGFHQAENFSSSTMTATKVLADP